MVKRPVRVWSHDDVDYTLKITLYDDKTYHMYFENKEGVVNKYGEPWHEDMLDLNYCIKDDDRTGIVKLEDGSEDVAAKTVVFAHAYPNKKNKENCIIT